MTPILVNPASATFNAGVGTVNVTIPTFADRMQILAYSGRANVMGANPACSGVVLISTGLPFTLYQTISRNVGGFALTAEIWYYMNPAPGADSVQWTPTNPMSCTSGAWCFTVCGVDQVTIWRDPGANNTGNDAAPTVIINSDINDLVIDSLGAWDPTTRSAPGPGQTELGDYVTLGSEGNSSYENGANPTVTMSWTLTVAIDWVICGGSIVPKSDFRMRSFKYIIDIRQNPPTILDEKGATVHPSEVESDCWIFLRDNDAPTSIQTDTFIDDDRMFYAEEVTYEEDSDKLTIRNNRQQLLDVIIARKGSGAIV